MGNFNGGLRATRDIRKHGDTWLAEVREDRSQNWKALEEWSSRYEPPKKKAELSKRKQDRRARIKARVKEIALTRIQDRISNKFVHIALEVSSHLLTNAEGKLKESMSSVVVMNQILNTGNGIILSFRFDTKKRKRHKFAFLRRRASDQLTDALIPALENLHDDVERGERAVALTKEIRIIMETEKDYLRTLIESKVDEILFQASARVDEGFERAQAKVEASLDDNVDNAFASFDFSAENVKKRARDALQNKTPVLHDVIRKLSFPENEDSDDADDEDQLVEQAVESEGRGDEQQLDRTAREEEKPKMKEGNDKTGCEEEQVGASDERTSTEVEKAKPTSDSQEPEEDDGTRAVNKPVLSSDDEDDELQQNIGSSDPVEDDANMVAISKPMNDECLEKDKVRMKNDIDNTDVKEPMESRQVQSKEMGEEDGEDVNDGSQLEQKPDDALQPTNSAEAPCGDDNNVNLENDSRIMSDQEDGNTMNMTPEQLPQPEAAEHEVQKQVDKNEVGDSHASLNVEKAQPLDPTIANAESDQTWTVDGNKKEVDGDSKRTEPVPLQQAEPVTTDKRELKVSDDANGDEDQIEPGDGQRDDSVLKTESEQSGQNAPPLVEAVEKTEDNEIMQGGSPTEQEDDPLCPEVASTEDENEEKDEAVPNEESGEESLANRADDVPVSSTSAITDDERQKTLLPVKGLLHSASTRERAKAALKEGITDRVAIQQAKVSMKQTKDALMDTFGSQIKELVVGKMEGLPDQVTTAMDEIIHIVDEFLKKYKDIQEKEHEELKEKVYDTIERVYAESVADVEAQCQQALGMFGGLLGKSGDEEDDEEEEEEE